MNSHAHLMEYAMYDTYRLAGPHPNGYPLKALVGAPLRADTLRSPWVWVPSILGPTAPNDGVQFCLEFSHDTGIRLRI